MTTSRVTIAVDVMGGDNDPEVSISAVLRACKKYHNVFFILFGNKEKIPSSLFSQIKDSSNSSISFVHCEEAVDHNDKPSVVLRRGERTSMGLAICAVRDGVADAILSSGNTGALMAMSKVMLGTISKIERPAIGSLMPSSKKPFFALDIGANVYMTPQQAVQFGIMGAAFYSSYSGNQNPRIGLMNIGSEDQKGTDAVKDAKAFMETVNMGGQFIGFVEPNSLMSGVCDVIVADGFTGNIFLKSVEGLGLLALENLDKVFRTNVLTRLSYLITRKHLKKTLSSIDPRKYNGAMLLGLSGVCIKSHGNADVSSFLNAIDITTLLVRSGVSQQIKDRVAQVEESAQNVGLPSSSDS